MQNAPVCKGAGEVQVRDKVLFANPQVPEQGADTVHSLQPPSTKELEGKDRLFDLFQVKFLSNI